MVLVRRSPSRYSRRCGLPPSPVCRIASQLRSSGVGRLIEIAISTSPGAPPEGFTARFSMFGTACAGIARNGGAATRRRAKTFFFMFRIIVRRTSGPAKHEGNSPRQEPGDADPERCRDAPSEQRRRADAPAACPCRFEQAGYAEAVKDVNGDKRREHQPASHQLIPRPVEQAGNDDQSVARDDERQDAEGSLVSHVRRCLSPRTRLA